MKKFNTLIFCLIFVGLRAQESEEQIFDACDDAQELNITFTYNSEIKQATENIVDTTIKNIVSNIDHAGSLIKTYALDLKKRFDDIQKESDVTTDQHDKSELSEKESVTNAKNQAEENEVKNKDNTSNDNQQSDDGKKESLKKIEMVDSKQINNSIICFMQEHYKPLIAATGIVVGIALYVWSSDNHDQQTDEN
ncbi:MAG: hypothetical protein ACXWL5_00185 [Candidatus Chromulinivorax sp.]